MNDIYESRVKKVSEWLKKNNLFAAVFEDSEEGRDVNIRYLTGMTSDALLVVSCEGKTVLSPWDEILASKLAHASKIIPLNKFNRDYCKALSEILKELDAPQNAIVELPSSTSYISFKKYEAEVPFCSFTVNENGVHSYVKDLRAVKDEYEIECTKKACAITDEMTEEITRRLKNGTLSQETEVALFAEKYLREQGAERTSFDTLAAGPARSWAIHAFPGYTAGSWGTQGLSILDYGVCYNGYASDCTITVARGPLSKEQEQLLDLVQQAADECIKLYKPGLKIKDAALCAEKVFAAAGKKMPHSLGHGTGLEIHERPFVRAAAEDDKVFVPGNIITLEPGLYDEKLGGTRLENDVLITEKGNLVLTSSKIIRL